MLIIKLFIEVFLGTERYINELLGIFGVIENFYTLYSFKSAIVLSKASLSKPES